MLAPLFVAAESGIHAVRFFPAASEVDAARFASALRRIQARELELHF